MTREYVINKLTELENQISKMSSAELKAIVRSANISEEDASQYSSLELALTEVGCPYLFEDEIDYEISYAESNDFSYALAA